MVCEPMGVCVSCNTVIGETQGWVQGEAGASVLGLMFNMLCLPFLSHCLVASTSSQGQVSDIRRSEGRKVTDTRSLPLISCLEWFLLLADHANMIIGHEEL